MTQLTQKELKIFAQKILEDYDKKNPGIIFKDKINISNAEALSIQSEVSKLREKRGEEVIGYKIGCISKETQGKMDSINLHTGDFGKVNCILMELI